MPQAGYGTEEGLRNVVNIGLLFSLLRLVVLAVVVAAAAAAFVVVVVRRRSS
jgi:subtilase family serine protease